MFDIPIEIKSLIDKENFSIDNVGLSGSTVVLFHDKILKIQKMSEEAENEFQFMQWLQGKLQVPKILGFVKDENNSYLLMTKVRGEMSCEEKYMENPKQLTSALAEGLIKLWDIDISNCPYSNNLEKKLQIAEYRVENNLVDIAEAEPNTFNESGFRNPRHLLEWLKCNKIKEDPVLSHGDFCLPNIFLENGVVSGYIDWGRAGIADKWQDIALCYRSLLHNFEGKYTGKKYPGFYPEMLFNKLGIEPDWNKIQYYILLDELF